MSLCRSYPDEEGPKHWSDSRYEHVMKLRQAALKSARDMWADYILVSLCSTGHGGGQGWSSPGKALYIGKAVGTSVSWGYCNNLGGLTGAVGDRVSLN